MVLALVVCEPASAKWYGSRMSGPVNAPYGCEAATIFGPLGGVQIAPTNQTSCTYKHNGYLGSNRLGSVVPSTGGSGASASARAPTRRSSG